jgi:hypothetical protein
VVEQSSDVVDKERVQRFSNLLLVRKLQCALKWNPAVC